nr:hypothetical protein CFP56_22556 [Quercus suber]
MGLDTGASLYVPTRKVTLYASITPSSEAGCSKSGAGKRELLVSIVLAGASVIAATDNNFIPRPDDEGNITSNDLLMLRTSLRIPMLSFVHAPEALNVCDSSFQSYQRGSLNYHSFPPLV